jgi:oligopeptidase B
LTRTDDYFWLRDRDNPEVLAYLQTENAYTEAIMAPTTALQQRLYAEMRGRLKESDESVPERRGAFEYITRTVTDKEYAVYSRRPIGTGPELERVLLDVNALAEGKPYCRLGAFEVSPDGRWLAYSVDHAGDERYTLYIKDLETGQRLPEALTDVYYGVAWANDNRTLFYPVLDEAQRPHRLYRHQIGTDPAEDVLVHDEPDQMFYVHARKTRSKRFIVIAIYSMTSSEARLVDADAPDNPPVLVRGRRPGVEYTADHQGEHLFIVTNEEALNFKLLRLPLADPAPERGQVLVPHRDDILLEAAFPFAQRLALIERRAGLRQMRLIDHDGGNPQPVTFPEPVYTFWADDNPENDQTALRITYSSLATPETVMDIDLRSGALATLKVDEVPSGHDPQTYITERLEVTAPDGARVPLSLLYRRDLARDGQAPALVHGYGAYGATVEPGFQREVLSLVDRGLIYAIAHVRGGADLGRAWYDAGKMKHKRNSFTDFIACAEALISGGYTRADRLAAIGTSAGGLLVGAAMVMRPDLFASVVARVPFVDVINTMSDPSIPLTAIEWEQWGNPAHPDEFEYMLSYSPYDNLRPGAYPHLLLTTGWNDPRVQYWEPAKLCAKLRTIKTDAKLLLLKTNLNAGHGGASGRFERLNEIAFEYAFILKTTDGQTDRLTP